MTSKDDWCRHYRAMSENDLCDAGITYKALAEKPFAKPGGLPCWGPKPGAVACDRFDGYTPEENAARHKRISRRLRMLGEALEAIAGEHQRTGAWQGAIACPCCDGGQLRWTKARNNGHVSARCSTDGCIHFIQ